MDQEDHLAILRDETKFVIERIRAAVKLQLDYWDDPNKSPPNLSVAEFLRLLNFIPRNLEPRWEQRTSSQGKYGLTGEDRVFNINFEIIRGRNKHLYYLKGFFFDRGNLKGVCIQSFRLEKTISRQKLRII